MMLKQIQEWLNNHSRGDCIPHRLKNLYISQEALKEMRDCLVSKTYYEYYYEREEH